MAITAQTVKELREKTGAGMMNCKKALEESKGDFTKAVENLRKKGLASAEKKSIRTTSEGIIEAYIHNGSKLGVLVELNCETDFVARREEFKELAKTVAMQIAASPEVQYLDLDEIPHEIKDKEISIESGKEDIKTKPKEIQEKIITNRVDKSMKALCLLHQPYVKDPNLTVDTLIKQTVALLGENIRINRFTKFSLGE